MIMQIQNQIVQKQIQTQIVQKLFTHFEKKLTHNIPVFCTNVVNLCVRVKVNKYNTF